MKPCVAYIVTLSISAEVLVNSENRRGNVTTAFALCSVTSPSAAAAAAELTNAQFGVDRFQELPKV